MKARTNPADARHAPSATLVLLTLLLAVGFSAGADKSTEPSKVKPEYLRQSIRLDFDAALSRSENYLQAFDVFENLAVVKAGWYGSSRNPDLLVIADLTNRRVRGPYRVSDRADARRPNPLGEFVAFGPGGREVLTGSDHELRFHNLQTLHVEQRLSAAHLAPDSPFEVWLSSAAVTRNRGRLLLRVEERAGTRGTGDVQLRQRPRGYQTHFVVLDVATRAPVSRCSVKPVEGPPADISSDGKLIAYAARARSDVEGGYARVFVVNAANCEVVRMWQYAVDPFEVRFLPDNQGLAITFTSGAVKARVVQIAGGTERFRVPSPAESKFRKRLAVSSDGAWIATTGGIFGLMRASRLAEQLPANRADLWSARNGTQMAIALVDYSDHTVPTDSWDREILFTADSRYLVFPAADWSLRFFQVPGQPGARH